MQQNDLLKMPLLSDCLSQAGRTPGVVALHINHCMDNSFYFTKELKKAFDDVIFIAVPYNNRKIPHDYDFTFYSATSEGEKYSVYKNNAIFVTDAYSLMECVDTMIEKAIDNEIMKHVRGGKKVIILEDGGYHYSVIDKLKQKYPMLEGAILGSVEQTTSGSLLSQAQQKAYPTFSVCRSRYKTRIESHFVVRRVIDSTIKIMRLLNDFIDFKNVVCIGYGVIGRTLCHQLRSYTDNIEVIDKVSDITDYAVDEGFAVWDGKFALSTIVFGNAGQPSFTMAMMQNFVCSEAKKLYLVSTTSKRDEFSLVLEWLESFESVRTDSYTIYKISNEKTVFLLAGGYPVNFCDKEEESLTFGIIDPVFSQMFLLSKLLVDNAKSGEFKNETYYLGYSETLDEKIDEESLVEKWCGEFDIDISLSNFNIHKYEKRLKSEG